MRWRDSIHDAISAFLFDLAVKTIRPQMIRAVKAHFEITPDREPQTVAGWVVCPDCGIEMPIGVAPLRLETNEAGEQEAFMDLQMDDVWAHAWTHGTDREA